MATFFSWLEQVVTVTWFNLQNLRQRLGSSAATVFGGKLVQKPRADAVEWAINPPPRRARPAQQPMRRHGWGRFRTRLLFLTGPFRHAAWH